MRQRYAPAMFRIVAAQFLASLVVAAAAWAVGGPHAALSSLLGGLACTLPNGLFALNLARAAQPRAACAADNLRAARARATAVAVALLLGELLKVVLTIALLVLIARTVQDLVWSALIAAVIAVLLVQGVALIRR